MKQQHGVPFPLDKPHVKNILKIVECSECAKSRVLYARKKFMIKTKWKSFWKIIFAYLGQVLLIFIKFPSYNVRENISHILWHGISGYMCILKYKKNLRKGEKEFFPQCNCCTGNRMKIRKRKVNKDMLKGAKKKKL